MYKKVNHYPDELKQRVIQEYLETDISQVALQKKYGIRGNACILKWMRKFGIEKPSEREIEILHAMTKESKKPTQELELENRIKELEKKLEHEKLRSMALDTLIDIAERKYKISIRKNSGAKQ